MLFIHQAIELVFRAGSCVLGSERVLVQLEVRVIDSVASNLDAETIA